MANAPVRHAAEWRKGRGSPWYVPGALGERPTSAPRFRPALFAAIATLSTLGLAIGACGDDPKQQGDNEPEGDFQVKVTRSEFPTAQRLAQTSDLILGVKNTGDEPLPELAFTIETVDGDDGPTADGSFDVYVDDPSLSNPNRPVWILENKFPRELGTPPPAGLSGGFRAQTNTFGFGSLEPGEEETIVWRVTPVQGGTYTLTYRVEAGLDGNGHGGSPRGSSAGRWGAGRGATTCRPNLNDMHTLAAYPDLDNR